MGQRSVRIVRPPPLDLAAARAAAHDLADSQSGIASRRQLARLGVSRWVIRHELAIQRWQRTGRQTIAVHNGPLSQAARQWVAVLEVGRRAALDGIAALQAAGCTALTDEVIDVIVPKSATPLHPPGVRVRESRRFDEASVISQGIRRTRPAVAAVHAALWAVTDRQATYFLVLVVQSGLARPRDVHAAAQAVRRHRRRKLLRTIVDDLAGGVRSLGELDVARDFRRRGLPEPSRQNMRRRPSGTEYLDVVFEEYDLTLEIDGAGHEELFQRLADLLRDIASATTRLTVVRIPLLVYHLDNEAVLDAVADLLASRGWRAAS